MNKFKKFLKSYEFKILLVNIFIAAIASFSLTINFSYVTLAVSIILLILANCLLFISRSIIKKEKINSQYKELLESLEIYCYIGDDSFRKFVESFNLNSELINYYDYNYKNNEYDEIKRSIEKNKNKGKKNSIELIKKINQEQEKLSTYFKTNKKLLNNLFNFLGFTLFFSSFIFSIVKLFL